MSIEQVPNQSISSPQKNTGLSSRVPGFYELSQRERLNLVQSFAGLSAQESKSIAHFGAISPELVDIFIENAIGTFSLPLGVATNFIVNERDVLVPMAVEESSVLAAASHGAKLARAGGGFTAKSSRPIMTGQIQLFPRRSLDFAAILTAEKKNLIDYANRGHERLMSRGGGAQDLEWKYLQDINMLILHLHIDTRDAMGANIVNTMCESVSTLAASILECDIGLRILTNLTEKRTVTSSCEIPIEAFSHSDQPDGLRVAERIVKASLFAENDIFRATTHNKGVMNGIDPVVIATGNDWRAVEAGAHAFAARSGTYKPLSIWRLSPDSKTLRGSIELPMALGIVGGVTKLHPTAQAALRLLGHPHAQQLAEIVASVGLAQNLAALRALATEGIQKGHMSLHQKNLDLLKRNPDPQLVDRFKRQGASRT